MQSSSNFDVRFICNPINYGKWCHQLWKFPTVFPRSMLFDDINHGKLGKYWGPLTPWWLIWKLMCQALELSSGNMESMESGKVLYGEKNGKNGKEILRISMDFLLEISMESIDVSLGKSHINTSRWALSRDDWSAWTTLFLSNTEEKVKGLH